MLILWEWGRPAGNRKDNKPDRANLSLFEGFADNDVLDCSAGSVPQTETNCNGTTFTGTGLSPVGTTDLEGTPGPLHQLCTSRSPSMICRAVYQARCQPVGFSLSAPA